jgi:hypothetical protein
MVIPSFLNEVPDNKADAVPCERLLLVDSEQAFICHGNELPAANRFWIDRNGRNMTNGP